MGAVGTAEGAADVTMLGDAANTAARLSSAAQPAEILVSEATVEQIEGQITYWESREMTAKGKEESAIVYVLGREDSQIQFESEG
jgi:class 3 adenylate cyclase